MARYIEVNALMNYANNQKDKTIDANDIARFPWADVRENIHAHWVFRRVGGWHCSKCDEQAPFWCMASTQNLAHFCPNCGAEMEAEHGEVH